MAGSQPGVGGATRYGADAFDFDAIGETITARFSSMLVSAAGAVAAIQDKGSLTYAELEKRSNQLARWLQRQGVRDGDLVGLLAGRSLDSLVAILAMLKCRAGYVPLDPAMPATYIDSMVRDCGTRLVLSAAAGPTSLSVPVVGFGEAMAAAREESADGLADRARPEDIAYVMYTSGSTGRPKGVRVPHRAVVRLVSGQTYCHFDADEVVLHNSPLAFDASTLEIWGTLLHGARAVLVSGARPSLQEIANAIRNNGATTAWFTAGLFHMLVDHQLDALAGLRQLLAGGDVLSPTHVRRALTALPNCRIVNGYGPTENTTFTCCYPVPREGWGDGPVPIGRPIAGTYVRLLDDDMKPVPDGETGMLYAGGLGLASGYLGDDRLTAAQFVPDPGYPGATLYRTGDLARLRPDGQIEFVGRRDRQVKIDGKRVELGEIEEVLRSAREVGDAVVTATRGTGSAPLLTGYVKPAAGATADPSVEASARAAAARLLPVHMQPAQIVVLDAFPLTTNGKVDVARLPAPSSALPGPTVASAHGATERTLADILARVLGTPQIGLETNFFDLGATSLKLVEAHALIARTWPDVEVLALFQHPNVGELARAIDRGATRTIAGTARRRADQQAAALKRLRGARTLR
ncbi:MAG: non-ribosomal peptide synthetase [Enhydrobacter sp.]|nr:MAG: non-ribosomal peptide synthetase [Enhydrobacter sp.]